MPAPVIRLPIKDWRSSRKTSTSTYISRTTFSSHALSTWKPRWSEAGDYGYLSCRIRDCIVRANRYGTLASADLCADACPRRGVISLADGFRDHGALLHGVPWHVSRRVESSANQRPREHRIHLSCLAPGARPRASVWLGGEFHYGNRLLLHTETQGSCKFFLPRGLAVLGNVDNWRGLALACHCLPLGVENPTAILGAAGISSVPYFLQRCLQASANGIRQRKVGCMDLRCHY